MNGAAHAGILRDAVHLVLCGAAAERVAAQLGLVAALGDVLDLAQRHDDLTHERVRAQLCPPVQADLASTSAVQTISLLYTTQLTILSSMTSPMNVCTPSLGRYRMTWRRHVSMRSMSLSQPNLDVALTKGP